MIFAVFDPSPLTLCINCSFLHLSYSIVYITRVGGNRSTFLRVALEWFLARGLGFGASVSLRSAFGFRPDFVLTEVRSVRISL